VSTFAIFLSSSFCIRYKVIRTAFRRELHQTPFSTGWFLRYGLPDVRRPSWVYPNQVQVHSSDASGNHALLEYNTGQLGFDVLRKLQSIPKPSGEPLMDSTTDDLQPHNPEQNRPSWIACSSTVGLPPCRSKRTRSEKLPGFSPISSRGGPHGTHSLPC